MVPLHVRREIDGFIADRLLEALWREALWLVHDGVATTGEIDDAIRYGPGLRWAQMGTFLTYRIAGGEGDMRHFIAQFGPALQWPWTRLTDVPELTDELLDTIVGAVRRAGGRALGARARAPPRRQPRRDPAGSAVGRRRAGRLLREHEERPPRRAPRTRCRTSTSPQPLRLHEEPVRTDWVDYNGHMTESRYLDVLANASDAFLRHVELNASYLAAATACTRPRRTSATSPRRTPATPSTSRRRCSGRTRSACTSSTRCATPASGTAVATGEHLLLHVDAETGRVCAMQEPLAGRIGTLARLHSAPPRARGSRPVTWGSRAADDAAAVLTSC